MPIFIRDAVTQEPAAPVRIKDVDQLDQVLGCVRELNPNWVVTEVVGYTGDYYDCTLAEYMLDLADQLEDVHHDE